LKLPLINADRLTMSILPEPGLNRRLPGWAERLRDRDVRWQEVSQTAAQDLRKLITRKKLSFAFETVFSHWRVLPDGRVESKIDLIDEVREAGYFVVLIFVGLTSWELSAARVETRKLGGGHAVPKKKLRSRFPRTQLAIRHAREVVDMSLFFDNSRDLAHAFSIARVEKQGAEILDCRRRPRSALARVARLWLDQVAP
jgi:predicted ABC-type ATPase